ncbi:MAG: hypothetical protein FJX62_02990 [Alphaproteobacteria bacterium]|nr:hypothetical protein [Alphaproteobacteria bacterium]
MSARFVFTVATGRCGQASFAELINRHVPNAYAAFEEPQVRPVLPGVLGDAERHFRRRFVETDELLGRGRVLQAFASGDDDYIERVARRRLGQIQRQIAGMGKSAFVDVSKFFARGLHIGYGRCTPKFGLVLLVRDPLKNMRSFLNRDKNFYKDNGPLDSARNQLCLDPARLEKGELYLWAWCELYLRFLAMREMPQVTHSAVIRTDDLTDNERMAGHLRALGLEFDSLTPVPAMNTNSESGRMPTRVTAEDVRTFDRFRERLPASAIDRIDYLKSYQPRATE